MKWVCARRHKKSVDHKMTRTSSVEIFTRPGIIFSRSILRYWHTPIKAFDVCTKFKELSDKQQNYLIVLFDYQRCHPLTHLLCCVMATGTARYASVNTHLGLEQGRRDDLEGLTYVLLYFLRGQLPWQGLQAANQKDKYHKICLKKQNIPVRELCKGLPAEFGTLLCYCRNLKFDETPNYNYCRKLLREVFEMNCYSLDYVYDWTVKQQVRFCFSHVGRAPRATRNQP